MYRYEVEASVKSDIEGVVGRPVFYEDESKFYIDAPGHEKSIMYWDNASSADVAKTLDQICDDLYSDTFANKSTKHSMHSTEKVEIDKGREDFDTLISHNFCDKDDWADENNSCWVVEASGTDKRALVSKTEVQFTHDVKLAAATPKGEFYCEFWAFNPLVDLGQTIDPDDRSFVPGVSTGNPLRFMVRQYVYKSIRDVFNYGNDHYTMPVAVDDLTTGLTTVQFNYDKIVELDGDKGIQMRFCMKDDEEMVGQFATVSVVVREEEL